MRLRRLGAIIVKELRQLRRDRLTFAMILVIPLVQLVLFGYAMNTDIRLLHAAVLDQSQTARSREAIAGLEAGGVIEVRFRVDTPQAIERLVREGRISVALVVPPDFEARIERRDRPPLQLIVDGSDQSVQSAARQLTGWTPPGWSRATTVEVVNYYNPERRAAMNTVPGLLGVILTMTMVLFTATALVRERERGNLEMLIATPVSPWELTLGKLLPYVGIGLLQVAVVLLAGWLLFEVPVRGSLPELYAAALVFICASLALGVFLSTLAQTQFQAMQLAFFSFLPQILLSGFLYPFPGMPKPAQAIAEILPMTHFLRLTRGIMVRGASLADLWEPLLMLALFATAALAFAVMRVRKSLD